jgi:Holliday junction resolvasome RuvABC endonuclease subunit
MIYGASPFIGIDPGLSKGKLGLSVIKQGKEIVQGYGVETLKNISGTIADTIRCEQLHSYTHQWLKEFTDRPLLIAGKCINTPIIAMEAPAYGRADPRTIQTGMVHNAILRAVLKLRYAYVFVVSPPTLKKYVTGKGNANKEAVMEFTIRKWFKHGVPFFGSQDLYEAYALSRFAQYMVEKPNKQLIAKVEAYEIRRGEVLPYKP